MAPFAVYVLTSDRAIADAVAAAAARRRAGRCPCCGILGERDAWGPVPAVETDGGVWVCGWCASTESDAAGFAARSAAFADRWSERLGRGAVADLAQWRDRRAASGDGQPAGSAMPGRV